MTKENPKVRHLQVDARSRFASLAGAIAALSVIVPLGEPHSRSRRSPEGPPQPELKHEPGTRQRKRWLEKQARKKNR